MDSVNPPTEESSELANLWDIGDPVDGNPFPPDNPRHAIWKEATLAAEEEKCRLSAQAMRNRITREGFWAWYQRGGNLVEFEKWVLDLHGERFNIWAKRGHYVVLDENDLRIYDHWLSTYATNYLHLMKRSRTVRDWPIGTCRLPGEFQSLLIEHVNHWKAVARQHLTYYRAEVKKLTEQDPTERTEKALEGHSTSKRTNSASTKIRIGQNIDKLRRESGWSYEKLADATGIDKKLVLSHVHGRHKPNPSTLKEYAQAFSRSLSRSITPNTLEE